MSVLHARVRGVQPAGAAPSCEPITFEDVVGAYKQRVTVVAYRITQNVEDARDVAQYAFMQLYRNWNRFDDRRAIERWLYVVARNEALNLCRTRERDSVAVTAATDDPAPAELEDTVVRNELGAAVRATIALLPAAARNVIELRHLRGIPPAEIASALGVPVKRVKQDVERAHLRLRFELLRRGLDHDVR